MSNRFVLNKASHIVYLRKSRSGPCFFICATRSEPIVCDLLLDFVATGVARRLLAVPRHKNSATKVCLPVRQNCPWRMRVFVGGRVPTQATCKRKGQGDGSMNRKSALQLLGIGVLLVVALSASASWVWADTPAEQPPAPTAPKLDTGDNAWMLTSSALVLMMTGPGLALFYSGLVRKKNVLSVMMQCVFLMCLMTVIWALYGYTLAFGGDATAAVDRQRATTCS